MVESWILSATRFEIGLETGLFANIGERGVC